MALYLNNVKYNINLNGKLYRLNLHTTKPSLDEYMISSDNFILQDKDGLFLLPKVELEKEAI